MKHTMHSRPSRERNRKRSFELNLTSAIDVVFLLLIFFIVTSHVSMGEGVIQYMPRGVGPHEPQPQTPIEMPLDLDVTSLGQSGYRIEVAGHPTQPASFADLQKMLAQLLDDPATGKRGLYAADNLIRIRTTTDVRWQHVVNAYNAALAAGYRNITINPVLVD